MCLRWLGLCSLSLSASCCFDITVTMTAASLIRKTVATCRGFWDHKAATAATDMPDVPLFPGFSYTLPPSLSLSFPSTLIFISLLLPALFPIAPALFVSCSFTFPPSLLLPCSLLRGVGFNGSESCFALKNSLS